jgi:nucleoid DNA-binding protein
VKEINLHIAYLLTKHECVVIPNFGAFVVFSIPSLRKELEGVFCPPAQSLGFNPEIKHNDGLLAHFISTTENITYTEADLLIKQYVDCLNERLSAGNPLNISKIGTLSASSEGKIAFIPDTYLSCNAANIGFNNFYLPQLRELEQLKENFGKEEKDTGVITISLNRRILSRTASIAAAILALFFIPVPLNNNTEHPISNASFFSLYHITEMEKEVKTQEKIPQEDIQLVTGDTELPATVQPDESTHKYRYYIIIASLPSEKLAEKSLADFKQAGFPDAAIISQNGRYRIYIKGFEKKADAEPYLIAFRQNNPKYADAWLFVN